MNLPTNWTESREEIAPTKSADLITHNLWRNEKTGEVVVHYELLGISGKNHIVESHTSSTEPNLINKIRESIVMRTTDLQDKDWVAPRNGKEIQKCISEQEAETVAQSYMR